MEHAADADGGGGESFGAKLARATSAIDDLKAALRAASGDEARSSHQRECFAAETLTVSVMRLDVGGGSDVERLDLDHGPDARRIKAENHAHRAQIFSQQEAGFCSCRLIAA